MHASRMRETQDHAYVGLFVVADQLECRRTALALAGHLAHADFVADHLDGLIAFNRLPMHQQHTRLSRSQTFQRVRAARLVKLKKNNSILLNTNVLSRFSIDNYRVVLIVMTIVGYNNL